MITIYFKKTLLVFIFIWVSVIYYGQSKYFEIGSRSTFSFFDEGSFNNKGIGIGGQFRVPINKRINTEWYADFIKTNLDNKVFNNTAHIGWSVLYYPWQSLQVKPYILAGHCFDYANYYTLINETPPEDRWSSAVQAGFGSHFNLTPRFDISLSAQYMVHLGKHIHIIEDEHDHIHFDSSQKEVDLQGHILFTGSINYKIFKL